MSRPGAWLSAALLSLVLAGCGLSKVFAPIQEAGKPRQAPEFYVIQPGDTLYKIAFEHGVDYRDLAAWNGISDIHFIRAGERLRLLPSRLPASKPAPGWSPAGKAPPSLDPTDSEFEVKTWIWPAHGRLLAAYNEMTGNKGIDIAGGLGGPVMAAAAGKVVYVGEGLRGYGKLIIIKHNQSTLSAYAHHSRILVREGQFVAQGQKIGEMGDSDADRVKLHFEIRRYGRPQDPLSFLPRNG